MTKRTLLALVVCMAFGLNAAAQDEAPDRQADEAGTPPGSRTPADGSQAPGNGRAQADGEAQANGEAQDSEDETEVEEEEFIFSEDIPADQQVTFPVDI
jgi:hypothetical protein